MYQEALNTQRTSPSFYRLLAGLFPLAASLLIGLYLLFVMDISDYFNLIRNVSPGWIIVGFALTWLNFGFRAVRLRCLLGREVCPPLKSLFHLQGIQSGLTYLLPPMMGEASMVFLLNRVANFGYAMSAAAILMLRIFDVIILLAVVAALNFTHGSLLAASPMLSLAMKTFVVFAVIAPLFLALAVYSKWFLGKLARYPLFQGNAVLNRWLAFFMRAQQHSADWLRSRNLILLIALSMASYATSYFLYVAACKAMHITLGMADIFWVFAATTPIEFLPIKGLLNFGSHEAGWVITLTLLGFTKEGAAAIAFGTHTLIMVMVMFPASLSMLTHYRQASLDFIVRGFKRFW